MLKRICAAITVVLALSAPAWAADQNNSNNLQLFRDVQKQVLTYPQFSVFDSVHMNFDDQGAVVLTGEVTMSYKKTDLAKRVAKLKGVRAGEKRWIWRATRGAAPHYRGATAHLRKILEA